IATTIINSISVKPFWFFIVDRSTWVDKISFFVAALNGRLCFSLRLFIQLQDLCQLMGHSIHDSFSKRKTRKSQKATTLG
ncbi:MAG: hypothetical protein RPR40_03595, partial [Bermanella sp.]